jgi:lipopolysaccharide transport system permease protein
VRQSSAGWRAIDLPEVWRYRELLFQIAWRNTTVRYKQTGLGVAWAVAKPLLTMLVFAMVFGHLGKLPSDGIPYSLFAYAALLPWSYFANAVTSSSSSLVSNAGLVTKVYFPRVLLPLSSLLSGLVDFGISTLVLVPLILWHREVLYWRWFTLPVMAALLVLTMAITLAIGLWLSALMVHFRDVQHALPFLVQIWLFATPVAWSSSMIPGRWRPFLGLNPLATVVDGFRWALFGRPRLDAGNVWLSVAIGACLLGGGVLFFRRTERTFADTI